MNVELSGLKHFKAVYVVFVDNTSLWWLKLLKRNFRHCYVLFQVDGLGTWLELNPMSNQTIINLYEYSPDFDYISYLEDFQKAVCVRTNVVSSPLKPAPIMAFTCVEFVKRIIGLHSRKVFTPHQLYKKIQVVGKKS